MFHADFNKTSHLFYDSVNLINCGIILVINTTEKKTFKIPMRFGASFETQH